MMVVVMIPAIVVIVIAVRAVMMMVMMVMMPRTVMVMVIRSSVPDRLACRQWGQSRRFGCVPVTSGLQPTPDMSLRRNNRRYVLDSDIVRSSPSIQLSWNTFLNSSLTARLASCVAAGS